MEEVTFYLDSTLIFTFDSVDVIYLVFQKAFDKVPHRRVVLKLLAHGIYGHVLAWTESWLNGRQQRVVLGGQMSEWRSVLNGVPQGSVLGPLLFVLYINDIDDSVSSKILKFADDTMIFYTVCSEESIGNLRTDLCRLFAWSKEWPMLFNIDKCKVMHLGYPSVDYFMESVQLQVVNEEKDVGVVVTNDLKWENQCVASVKKANKVLGMIKGAALRTDQKKQLWHYTNLSLDHI